MSDFLSIIDRVLSHEGGYVNDPRDPGGETHWGISKRAYPHVNIRDMTRAYAVELYRRDYWEKMRCPEMPLVVAFQLLDAAINHGRGNAVRWLQRALHVADDGIVGPVTLNALGRTDVLAVVLVFNGERLRFYARLKHFDVFGRGWVRRLAANLHYAIEDEAWHGRKSASTEPQKTGG